MEIFPLPLTENYFSGNISATDISVADILPEKFSYLDQEI
jgi:hypothetical protein